MANESHQFALEIYSLAHPEQQSKRDADLDAILERTVRDPADEDGGSDLHTLKKILRSIESMPLSTFTKSRLEPLEASALSVVFKGAVLTRIRNLEN